MVVEEHKIGNTTICIHDDYILPKEKIKEVEKRLSVLLFNHLCNEKNKTKD